VEAGPSERWGTNLVPGLQASERDKLANRSIAISRLSKLPPFHPTVLRLLAVSTERDSAITDFEMVFQGDPALASHLLMVANSPIYGFRNRVDSVRHAIALMGLEGVRSLAFTLAIGSYVRGPQTTAAVRSVWNHSLATAVVAETIGAACGQNVPLLYTAGLLHDVGRLGLLSIERQRYAGVLQRTYFDLEESLLLEDLLFGCAHDDAGAFLARSWGFPEHLCDCIRYHHHPDEMAANRLLQQTIQYACYTAGSLGMAEVQCEDDPSEHVDEFLAARLEGVPAMKPERLLARINKVMESLVSADAHPGAMSGTYS
jgi:putative nucleotidyltransferase with HDIG domain